MAKLNAIDRPPDGILGGGGAVLYALFIGLPVVALLSKEHFYRGAGSGSQREHQPCRALPVYTRSQLKSAIATLQGTWSPCMALVQTGS